MCSDHKRNREKITGAALLYLDRAAQNLYNKFHAAVVESADTRDLKSLDGNIVRVQVSSAAPSALLSKGKQGVIIICRRQFPRSFYNRPAINAGRFVYPQF